VADVFVSYARSDAPQAAKIAESLNAAGYEVWWDSELLPHHAFAASIEQEIRAARAVVVVWSRQAVASQWVRAEADLARSQGKLVQVSLDQCDLPLPFSQYQAADLRTWKGDPSDPRWTKVVASVAQLTRRAAEGSAVPAKTTRPALFPGGARRPWVWIGLGAACIAVLALGGLWLARSVFQLPARGTRIAVRPYETIGGTAAIHDFAAGLSESLQDTLNQDRLPTVSSSDAQTLEGPNLPARLKALDVGLVLSGTVQADGEIVTVRTRLDDALHHVTLWTADVAGTSGQLQPLQAQIGARTVAVLGCSAQALNRQSGIADADILALFLHACDLAETSHHGTTDDKSANAMLDAMREVARKAPNFAAAHSILAKHDAFLVDSLPGQSAALRQEAAREAHRAQDLDPKDPDALVAFGLLEPGLNFAKRESWFRQALAADPSWPHANGFLANVMQDLGRLDEACAFYQRAASVNPLSTDWDEFAASCLILEGDTKQADSDLARISRLWPRDPFVWRFQLMSLIAQHRWADALAHLDTASSNLPTDSGLPLQRWRAELDALNTHNAGALAERRQFDLTKLAAAAPDRAIESLSLLGFVDDAYAVAQHYQPVRPDGTDSPRFLFGPETAALRRDPRFMALANKFGLPQYWGATGKWPDFCADPDLPYNCRAEAAKLKPVAGLFPKGN
jgi:tetratricopeptide (TPR) repeat protein